jgi:hypothetical protein
LGTTRAVTATSLPRWAGVAGMLLGGVLGSASCYGLALLL